MGMTPTPPCSARRPAPTFLYIAFAALISGCGAAELDESLVDESALDTTGEDTAALTAAATTITLTAVADGEKPNNGPFDGTRPQFNYFGPNGGGTGAIRFVIPGIAAVKRAILRLTVPADYPFGLDFALMQPWNCGAWTDASTSFPCGGAFYGFFAVAVDNVARTADFDVSSAIVSKSSPTFLVWQYAFVTREGGAAPKLIIETAPLQTTNTRAAFADAATSSATPTVPEGHAQSVLARDEFIIGDEIRGKAYFSFGLPATVVQRATVRLMPDRENPVDVVVGAACGAVKEDSTTYANPPALTAITTTFHGFVPESHLGVPVRIQVTDAVNGAIAQGCKNITFSVMPVWNTPRVMDMTASFKSREAASDRPRIYFE